MGRAIHTHSDAHYTLIPVELRIHGVQLSCDQLGDGIIMGTVGTLLTITVINASTQYNSHI